MHRAAVFSRGRESTDDCSLPISLLKRAGLIAGGCNGLRQNGYVPKGSVGVLKDLASPQWAICSCVVPMGSYCELSHPDGH
eukprot:8859232-Lingulodinium_polyedra.AAC.1